MLLLVGREALEECVWTMPGECSGEEGGTECAPKGTARGVDVDLEGKMDVDPRSRREMERHIETIEQGHGATEA